MNQYNDFFKQMKKDLRKIPKSKFNKFAERAAKKAKNAANINQLLIIHKAINNATKLLNIHHNNKFDIKKFKNVSFDTILRLNENWKNQTEIRRYMIQSHSDFFCPISKKCLDINETFILRNQIFHFKALEKLKRDAYKEIDLQGFAL